MYFVHLAIGECFFLRLLLIVVSGVTSFKHLRTIDDIKHLTFQATYRALGLLQNDAEWDTWMREACIDQDAKRLRNLFVTLVMFYSPLNPKVLWERYRDNMSHNMWHQRVANGNTTEDAYNNTLVFFKLKLTLTNKGLHNFLEMCSLCRLRKCHSFCHLQKCRMSMFNLLWNLTMIKMYSMATSTKISCGSTFVRKQLSL
jgi:hypothetical protein